MPIVNAWGKLIQAPDDMSHEEIQSIIIANEKDLNPDYKPPSGGAREFIENNFLGFSTKEKPSIADQAEATADEGANTAAPQVKGAPVRQSFYNKALLDPSVGIPETERFRKPDREGILARTRYAADEDIKGQVQQRELEGLRTDENVPEGGFVASAKSMAGQTIKGAGQLGSDYFGADKDNALIKYGEEILKENPVAIKDLNDIADRPFLAFKEASGNMVPSFGAMLGTAALGQGIISVAPLTGPLAPVVAAVGAGVKWLGPAAIAALPSYGSIRDKQIFNHKANQDDWKAKAIAGLGASAVGAIEVAFGPQNWAINMLTKEGRAALTRKLAATTPMEAFLKGGLVGGISEGSEELVQNPIEQLSSFDNPLEKKNLEETAFGGAMGFIGGFAPGGVTTTASHIANQAQLKADRINAERVKLGLDKIVNSTNVDEAINAANESVSRNPVNKDDVLRVADPTLADIERLTGLKPSESIQEAERQQSILAQAQQENIAAQSNVEGQNNQVEKTPRDTEIVLPDNRTLSAQWDIVDADNVKASLKNGESQPRDRTRAASDLQIQSIAKNPDYRRLSDSPVMDIGAPVLSNDGQIVGGNGRFEALSRAYDQSTVQEYLDNLRQDAIRKGLDPSVIDQMKKPVLVRRVSQPFDTRELAIASNSGTSAQYSDLEQAKIDSDRLQGLENIVTTDSGDIALTPDNIKLVRDSLSKYSPAEVAPFVDANGQLSQQGMKRIRNAMLAKAYGDNKVIQSLIESNDSDIRNILGALTRVVGDAVKAQSTAPKESNVTPSILEAINIYNQLKQKNQPVSNYLQQQDAFSDKVSPAVENILMFLDKNARSQPKITEFFRDAYTKLGSIDTKTADIFGEEVKPKPEDLFAKPTIESQLEKHLKKNGYEFDVKPVTEREFNELDNTKKAQKELAEKQAKIFGKKVVFVKTKGKFGINGVMVPAIKDTIFIDLNTPKPFHAVMAHELSHWMEQENPKAYKDMLAALKDIIINESGYSKKYGITDQTEGLIPREIAGDLMGDNFTKPEFWQKVAEYNPSKFKEIADAIIKWLKNIVLKAKARGMVSEEWVTDAKKAQDIIAKAVSQYTKEQDAIGEKVEFKKKSEGDLQFSKDKESKDNDRLRSWMPVPRSPGWTEEKIIRALKSKLWSRSFGKSIVLKEIAKFDSAKEFEDHIYYHGTSNHLGSSLVPSITMSEAQAERSGGGGYGERYWAISLSKNKNIASNFTGQSRYGNVYGVILKKGANVKEIPGVQDAADIEDHIVQLWNEGVDAVRIGGGEEELAVLNPYAIVRYADGESFQVFQKKKFEPLTTDQIEDIYSAAKDYDNKLKSTPFEERKNIEVPEIKFSKQEKELNDYSMDNKYPAREDNVRLSMRSGNDNQMFSESNRLTNIDHESITWKTILRENPALIKSKGNVIIYRATIGNSIRNNDYVALNKLIAEDHLESLKDRGEDGRIITKEANIDDLLMANDATEFIYSPKFSKQEKLPDTINIDGIERPTTNSEGKPIYPTEEGVRNFWKWFGDSKVVDDQGRPLVVYHGSKNGNINIFDESLSRDIGIHFSEKDLSGKFGGNKYAVYLKIINPESIIDIFSVDGSGYGVYSKQVPGAIDTALDLLSDQSEKLYELGKKVERSWVDNKEFVNIKSKPYKAFWKEVLKLANEEGVDGFEYNNRYEGGGNSYVVFNPNQIKSAIGNNGEFSEDNNDIRFSKEEKLTDNESKLIIDTFNIFSESKVNKVWKVEDSNNIKAKSIAFQELAKNNGYEFNRDAEGSKYFSIKNISNDAQLNVRVSDHSNVNRSNHFGETDINLATDDGEYPVDSFSSALYKMRHASVDEDGNTLIDGKESVRFSSQKPFNPNEDIEETKAQKAQRIGQDKFNRFRVVKEWLAKEKGINLSEAADVYGAETRYYGKVANQQEDFRNKVRNPLIEKIAKAGYKLDEVEQYLLNRHAQEANAQNRKLTGKDDSTAYGISDAEAQAYLDKAPKELAKLADEVQALTDKAQQLRLDNGIETQERIDAMNGAYKYYVPVRGDAESQQKKTQFKGTGKGFSLKYKPKRRLGHELRNESVIENIFQDYERAIIQVEKNRIGKSLALMAAEIQMPELVSIEQPVKRKVLQTQKAYGVLVKGDLVDVFQTQEAAKQNRQLLVATDKKLTLSDITIAPITDQRLIYSASPMLADNEVVGYMNGHEIRLQINDELMARAYKNMGAEPLGHILSAGRAINGWMSKVYTGYNPEFILTNIQRDFQSGFINLTGEQGILVAGKAVANYPKSFASLLKYAATGESDKWIDSYRENGGNTGAAYLPDLERLGEEVKKEYASYQGVIANLKEGDSANALRAAGRKTFNATLKYIEHLNAAGENAFRLATFKAMVESGKSVAESANMAKNVTVNFNRKGEMGAELNALYLFFNASVQGTAATSHALFKGRHKYQAWGLVGAMMSIGYMTAAMLGGFDDEDEYDKVSDAVKSRNLIMSYGDGYVKIPVPYGYGFFYNAGRMYADAQRKGELGKMPYQLMALATEEFSPFNVASTEDSEFSSRKFNYGLLPTVVRIPTEITNNFSSFTGRELYPEKEWYKSEPDNEKMWRGTKGTVYDVSAQYLASIGVEISPETLKFLTRTATGGSGAFVDTSVSSAMLKKEGAELDTREIPFVRKFYGENTIQDARSRYGKAKEEAREAYEKFSALSRKEDFVSMEKFLNDKEELLALNDYANKLSEVIKIIRDQQDEIKLSDKYTTAEKRLMIKEKEKEEESYYDMFMEQYKHIKKK